MNPKRPWGTRYKSEVVLDSVGRLTEQWHLPPFITVQFATYLHQSVVARFGPDATIEFKPRRTMDGPRTIVTVTAPRLGRLSGIIGG